MHYDPHARRDTPLALMLKQRIGREGPISVAQYMHACLQDPEHGYYVVQPAVGGAGDFITAPEISQVFGEMVGLWCAVTWQQMGSPARVRLVELGPGRATLMRDALRAAKVMPAFLAAVHVDLIETNTVLAATQRAALSDAGVPLAWWKTLAEAPSDAPCLVMANEFLDALPVSQCVLDKGQWVERVVTLDDAGQLAFGRSSVNHMPDQGRFARGRANGFGDDRGGAPDVGETRSDASLLHDLTERSSGAPLAALFIDYGHLRSSPGETLQAVRDHGYEHPLTSPGEADLTTHVDFQEFAEKAAANGLAVDGPVTQGAFLGALGIVPRASRLMAANPRIAHEIEAGVARLISPTGMGTRFKAIGLRSPSLPLMPGFPPAAK